MMEFPRKKKMGIWIEANKEDHRLGVTTDVQMPLTPDNFNAAVASLGETLGQLLADMGVLPPKPDEPEHP